MESVALSSDDAVTVEADRLLKRLAQGAVTLPVLPAAAQRVMSLANDADASMRDIVDALKGDQSLTSYVLKVANSPLFSPTSPIVSVQQACTRLGARQLRDLALMVSVSSTFKVDGWERELSALFRHAVGIAFFAQEIARMRRLNVEEAFLAGLLADVGMSAALPLAVEAKLDRAGTLLLVQRVHTRVGATLVKGWSLPRSIEMVARHHHESGRVEILIQVVQIAELLVGVVFEDVNRVRLDAHPAIEALMLYPEDIDALLELGPQAIRSSGRVLMSGAEEFDVAVIGSGPAGHGAALAAARAGQRVIVIEQDRGVGGACVTHGTIPSKTLRETALALSNFRRKTGDAFRVDASGATQVLALMRRLDEVVSAHEQVMTAQLTRASVELRHGRVRFVASDRVMVRSVRGVETAIEARVVIIATGSRPRSPAEIPVDHEHVLDSDSILSMAYLPRSLTVVGGGVIACEYASIFAVLGVSVTIVDKAKGPLGFLDPSLSSKFVESFLARGGQTRFGSGVRSVSVDPTAGVTLTLADGSRLVSDKVLVAQGRIANVAGLDLAAIGLTTDARGLVTVDVNGHTGVGKVYAAGDVIGPPSLAASSMEQGRRAVCHSLGQAMPTRSGDVPTGVYTIPELASIGLTEAQAREKFKDVVIGRAALEEISRGQIAAIDDGMLKLVVEGSTRRVVGVHICGEGAAELVGIGQVAIASDWDVDRFVETTFNFPTLAEAYRVAALDAIAELLPLSARRLNDLDGHVHDAGLHHPQLLRCSA